MVWHGRAPGIHVVPAAGARPGLRLSPGGDFCTIYGNVTVQRSRALIVPGINGVIRPGFLVLPVHLFYKTTTPPADPRAGETGTWCGVEDKKNMAPITELHIQHENTGGLA